MYFLSDFANFAKPFQPPKLGHIKSVVNQASSFVKRSNLGRIKPKTLPEFVIHDATHNAAGEQGLIISSNSKAIKVLSQRIDKANKRVAHAKSVGTYDSLPSGVKKMHAAYLEGATKTEKGDLALSARIHLKKALDLKNYRTESYITGLQGLKPDHPVYTGLDIGGKRDRAKAYWQGRKERKQGKVPADVLRLQAYEEINPERTRLLVGRAIKSVYKAKNSPRRKRGRYKPRIKRT